MQSVGLGPAPAFEPQERDVPDLVGAAVAVGNQRTASGPHRRRLAAVAHARVQQRLLGQAPVRIDHRGAERHGGPPLVPRGPVRVLRHLPSVEPEDAHALALLQQRDEPTLGR